MALGLLARGAHAIKASPNRLTRQISSRATVGAARIVSSRARPDMRPRSSLPLGAAPRGARSVFIQTESTPNVDALKFCPNHRVLPESISAPYLEYLAPRDTISPPYPSPLAAKLMDIEGVISVFYGSDFITVTKKPDTEWAHVRPEVFALITETVTAGAPIVTPSEGKKDVGVFGEEKDSLAEDPDDEPVVGMIKELLATRIRPAIQEDGGDIDYRGFENGFVLLKLRGACRTCSSGEDTLKQGIEGMLMHYVSLIAAFIPQKWFN